MYCMHSLLHGMLKDTINDLASFNIARLEKVETNKFAKPTRVVVVHSLGISKRFKDGTVNMWRCGVVVGMKR